MKGKILKPGYRTGVACAIADSFVLAKSQPLARPIRPEYARLRGEGLTHSL